jgi:aspartyl-tRNA(Asn)/glutamyl-tRNA(Gln) amidotransferase subunit C
VAPLAHVIPLFSVFREDQVRESPPLDAVLENAPAREDGNFLVPRVI